MRVMLLFSALAFSAFAAAQDLSLTDAVRMALEKNGNVLAAAYDTESSKSRLLKANAAFFPTVTPTYQYSDNRSTGFTSANSFAGSSYRQTTVDVAVGWTLLDSGNRWTAYRQSQAGYGAARLGERNTRRNQILSVVSDFYDALRGQELLRVAKESLARAVEQQRITYGLGDEGAIAKKEKLQADTDVANAKVQLLQAEQRMRVSFATLRADIGWEGDTPLPSLVPPAPPSPPASFEPLAVLQERGLEARPDLRQQQESIRSLRYALRQAVMDSRISFQLNVNFNRRFELDIGDNRQLTFVASIPLFDAGVSRENIRESRLSRDAATARLTQSERQVRSEIEAAYYTLVQQKEQLDATQVALKSARNNYEAAIESRKEGAGTLADVVNAQLSLVTAETNAVQAVYDYLIAETQLRFATGAPMLGETP